MRGEEGERGRGQSHRRPTPRVHTSNHGKRRTTTLKPYSIPIHNRMWRKMGEGAAGLWQGVRGPSSRASCGTASGLPGCHRRHGFPSMFACGAGWIGPASGATLGSALGRCGATGGGCIGGAHWDSWVGLGMRSGQYRQAYAFPPFWWRFFTICLTSWVLFCTVTHTL